MPKCIECNLFDGEQCTKNGFYSKKPELNLPCRGFEFSSKFHCLKNYNDYCKHRTIIDTPFSADWCNMKNTYCNNNKLKFEEN